MGKEIYVLLTNTGTLLARSIQFWTGESYCHVSLAFDTDLREVYSFGRKVQSNPWVGGFVQEDIRGPLFRHSPCRIYKLSVSDEAYMKIREEIAHFIKEEDKYHYNFLGIFAVMLKYNWQRENHYFCSQFVNRLLQDANIYIINKEPALTTPADFLSAENDLELVYHGSIRAYFGVLYRNKRKQFRTA